MVGGNRAEHRGTCDHPQAAERPANVPARNGQNNYNNELEIKTTKSTSSSLDVLKKKEFSKKT